MRAEALLALLLCCSWAGLGIALFEDQAGTFDWYKQHVGLVQAAVFHPSKPRVCAATQQSVLGCLNLRDGTVAWRKLLEQGRDAAFLPVDEQHMLIVATHSMVHGFDLEGNLKWEKPLGPCAQHGGHTGPRLHKMTTLQPDGQKTSLVLVLHAGAMLAFDASTGSELLSAPAKQELRQPNTLLLALGESPAAVAYANGAVELTSALVGSLTGGSVALGRIGSPLPLSGASAASSSSFVVVSQDGGSLCVGGMTGDALPAELTCVGLGTLVPELTAGPGLTVTATGSGYLLLSPDSGAALLQEGADGALSLVQFYAGVLGVSAPQASDQGPVVGLVHALPSGELVLRVASVSSGAVLLEDSYKGAALPVRVLGSAPPLSVAAVALGTFKKKDRSDGFRALVAFGDGRMAFVQQGTLVWSRDESLSTITATMFVDLPAHRHGGDSEEGGAGGAAAAPQPDKSDLSLWLRSQVLGTKVQLKLNTPEEATELLALREQLSDKDRPVRDVNGFRKMLLALTETGKLVAMHNGNGHTMWARAFAPGSAPTRLLPWRTFHDVTHSPEVLALLPSGPGAHATVLNAHTGKELSSTPLPHAADLLVPLPTQLHSGSEYQHVYLVISLPAGAGAGAPPRVRLLPDSAPAHKLFAEQHHSLFFWTRDEGPSGAFRGYGFDAAGAAAAAAGAGAPGGEGIPAVLAWQLQLPDPVLAVAARDPSEPIQTSVKVLPDHTIKYKYLNPNTLFIATGLAAGKPAPSAAAAARSAAAADAVDVAGGAGGGAAAQAELTAYVVDTATGRVLYRQVHEGARGPVSAVISENMVVYFYWDLAAARHVACSLELYDANPARTFNVLDYLFNPNSTQPVSSADATPVEAHSLSFFSRLVPRQLAATRTEQGITAKQLLIVTNTDQVYSMDRRWVDPRRPKRQKLTPEEQEERLLPYQDTLAVQGTAFATLDKQVLGVRGVTVEPTRLESTCLVFVHGVDLFYSRLSPARGFDSLEDDFNYALLVTALVGLAVGAVAMQLAVKKSALARKWK